MIFGDSAAHRKDGVDRDPNRWQFPSRPRVPDGFPVTLRSLDVMGGPSGAEAGEDLVSEQPNDEIVSREVV